MTDPNTFDPKFKEELTLQGERLLKRVIRLPDNRRYAYVFSELPRKGYTRRFSCNVCQRQISGLKLLLQHSTHPIHASNLLLGNFMHDSSSIVDSLPEDAEEESQDPKADDKDGTTPNVVPGEPVPPGMEEVVEQQCQIQSSFDAYTAGPLIGLEYIVELIVDDISERRYICLLCEKKGDPRSVLVHVTSYNHYLKYICCFFRAVGNKLNMMPKTTNRRTLNTAVLKIAEAIEKHYGRLKPTSASFDTFSVKKYEILREIDERDHFRETPTLTFLELITADKMKEYSLQPVIRESPLALQKAEEEKKAEQLKIEKEIARDKERSRRNDPNGRQKKPPGKELENNVVVKQEKDDKEPKKLTIALKKPERAIPGLKQTEVQNPTMSQLGNLPPLSSDKSSEEVNQANTVPANQEEAMEEGNDSEDDVIILGDEGNEAIEVNSLSSISDSSLKSDSKSKSGTQRRRRRRYRSRSRDRLRDRSSDRLGRIDRGRRSLDRRGRGTSRDRIRTSRDRARTSRDRTRTSRDRSRTSRERTKTSRDRSRGRISRDRSRGRYPDRRGRDLRDLNRFDRREDLRNIDRGRDLRDEILHRSPDRKYRSISPRDKRDVGGNDHSTEKDSLRSYERGRSRESDRRDNRTITETSRERDRLRVDRYSQLNRYPERSADSRDRFRAEISRGDRRDSPSRERERHRDADPLYERDKRRSAEYDYLNRRRDRDRNFESNERLLQIQGEREKKRKWEAYTEELTKVEEEVSLSYKYFQVRPERHPMYPDEWKSFWNRRYKEIQLTGQDPNAYDYKPEWILFWQKKMKELQETELTTKKEEVKVRHKITPADEPISDLQDISPPTPEQPKDVTVQDIKKTWKELTGSEITTTEPVTEKDKKRSPSPWEEGTRGNKRSLSPLEERGRRTPPWEKNKHSSQSWDQRKSPPPPQYDSNKREPRERSDSHFRAPVPPVVHCLRLLSVLEQQLGMQGPRVLELLTQALALEKTRPSGSMLLLENKDIYLFFEAIMEKLRGQLMVGVVMRHLVGTTMSVIKAIKIMLTRCPLKPEVFEPVTVPGVGAVDKVAVAQKIAASLVAMGRTNVSQEELEQLISAVVGMAASDNISADQTSDKFFSQLDMKNSNASSHINTILQSMIATAQLSVKTVEPEVHTQSEKSASVNEPKSVVPVKDNVELVKTPEPDIAIPGLGTEPEVVNRVPSPFSLRKDTGANPIGPEVPKIQNITSYEVEDDEDDEDEDDYSFEDVFQAADKKAKLTEMEKKKDSIDTPEADNSQTQSSFTSSIPAESVKAVSDLFKSLSAINSAPPPEPPKEDPTNQMLANIASLSQPLTLPEEPPVTKPFDNNSTLVATIKNSLVESFTKDNATSNAAVLSKESFSTNVEPSQQSREPRRVLDPRSREQWDPSLQNLAKKESSYPSDTDRWEENRWHQGYGQSEQYDSRSDVAYNAHDVYRAADPHYRPPLYRGGYGPAPVRESDYGPVSRDYATPSSAYGNASYAESYGSGPLRESDYYEIGAPSNHPHFRSQAINPRDRVPPNASSIPRPWAPSSARSGYY